MCITSFSWHQSEPWLYPLNMGRWHFTSIPIVNHTIPFTLACWLWLCYLLEYAALINNILLKNYYLSFRVSGIVLLRTLSSKFWFFSAEWDWGCFGENFKHHQRKYVGAWLLFTFLTIPWLVIFAQMYTLMVLKILPKAFYILLCRK